MSAATREGIDDVIAYVSQILKDAEEIELVIRRRIICTRT